MSTESNASPETPPGELPPWPECNCFCIQDYSHAGGAPCGWRGRLRDARRDETGAKLFCPRCGSATLLRLPAAADGPQA